MANSDDQDEQDIVVDFVHDAVVTGPDSPFTFAAGEFLGTVWSRLILQQFNGRLDTRRAGIGSWITRHTVAGCIVRTSVR